MNRPARCTTADIRRALRAVEQTGPGYAVEVLPDGTIRIVKSETPSASVRKRPIEPVPEIVL